MTDQIVYNSPLIDHLRQLRLQREAQGVPAQTAKYNTSPNRMAPQELLDQAYKTYTEDRAKLANLPYPTYSGKTTAPMSTLTQKAREYQERFANKPAPFSRKLQTVLNKPNEGLSAQQTQELLNRIRQSQTGANENINLQALRNQFGTSFTPQREQAFRGAANQDIERGLGGFSDRLRELNQVAGNLEGVKNRQVGETFKNLQQGKQARREGLISQLEQFGNQKHAHTNKMLASERAKFVQEAEAPYRRLDQLAATIEPARNRLANAGGHPDLERMSGQEVSKALQDYKAGTPTYPGKTVAALTPEMQASYDLLERINPSFKDSYAPQRKQIIRNFLGNDTTAARALQNVPGVTQGKISQLEDEARQRIQKDLAAINNRYTKLGQYGSEQHLKEAERRAQEINKALLEQRNNDTGNALGRQISLQHEDEINNLKKLNLMGSLGQQEFGSTLGNIRNLNKQGATKWRNEQDELEELYKNYQNELNWGKPGVSSASKENAANEIFGNNEARGLQLEELKNLQARYSELEKERNQLQSDIRTIPQFQAAQPQVVQQQRQRAAQLQQANAAKEAELLRQKKQSPLADISKDPRYFDYMMSAVLLQPYNHTATERNQALNHMTPLKQNYPGYSLDNFDPYAALASTPTNPYSGWNNIRNLRQNLKGNLISQYGTSLVPHQNI